MNRKERRRLEKQAKKTVCGASGESPQAALAAAVEHHQAGRLKEAANRYQRILRTQPEHPDALHLLGVIAYQTGKGKTAIDLICRAITVKSDEPAYFSNLGNALKAEGRLDKAITSYRQALDLNGNLAEVHSNLGNALREQGKLEEAIASYRRALAIDSNLAQAHSNLGSALHDLGKIDQAIACYMRALEANPNFAEAYSNCGNALQDQGKLEEAIASYQRALAIDPSLPETHANLGHALQALGNLKEAIAAYRRALSFQPDDADLQMALRRALSRQLPPWHFPMLADTVRNDTFERAIAKVVEPSSRVLDIGTGSGLLALMAARAGAARVTACEMSNPLAEAARQIVADNSLADRITVINKKSTQLKVGDDMEDRANLLVSEILDAGLIGEGMIPAMRHALQNLVTPDGKVIPRSADIFAMLVALPRLRSVNPVHEISGFDLSAFDRFRNPHEYKALDLGHEDHRPLTKVFAAMTFDFRDPPPAAPRSQPHEIMLDAEVIADGMVHAIAFWFDLHLDDEITLSTRPGGDLSHWNQAVQFFDDDMAVKPGQIVPVKMCYSDLGIRFAL